MRRGLGRGLAALAAAWLLPAPAAGQLPAEPAGLADVPSGPGRIEGRLVHPAGPEAAADVEVVLYAIGTDGSPGLRRGRSDALGRFAFEQVAVEGTSYLLAARYRGIPFPGDRLVFEPGQRSLAATVNLFDRTADPAAVRVREAAIRIERLGAEVAVEEVHTVDNTAPQVVVRDPEERSGAKAAFRAALPGEPTRFALPYALEPEGFERKGRTLRFWGPLFPGPQQISFSYTLPVSDGAETLTKAFPAGAERVRIRVASAGLALVGLGPGEPEEYEGRPYVAFDAGAVAPGDSLVLQLDVAPTRRDPAALSVPAVRAFLEIDDAALSVSEEHNLEVSGGTPLVGAEGAPLLRIPLPEGARNLRFGQQALAMGATLEEGVLALRGPVPPGASRVELAYRLPATPDAAEGTPFARAFDRPVPSLSIFVADTGLAVESERLHRRRPVKAEDRLYLHFEAFYVDADERVSLSLRGISRAGPLAPAARVAFVGGAALAAALFLALPLLRSGLRDVEAVEAPRARREREALYEDIRDLDHDFETGKVAEEDYRALRDELRLRAVGLLREEQQTGEAPTGALGADSGEGAAADADRAAAAPPACPDCARGVPADARFCPQCGTPLHGPRA